jgi:hypothetical protein
VSDVAERRDLPQRPAEPPPAPPRDDRLVEMGWFHRAMRRPELGAVAGLIVVVVSSPSSRAARCSPCQA